MNKRSELTIMQKYGYRTFIILILLFIFSTFLLIEYLITGQDHPTLLVLAILFYIIFLILAIGFSLTNVKKINKKYFQTDSLIGQKGRVTRGVKAGEKGTAQVSNEEWSFICDSDTYDNELVEVTGVLEDKVTIKIKKLS
jgi:membrane protein implicated in regulation of membrane protease activity